MRCRPGRGPASERGAVTAELVMAIPLLLALTVGLVWLLALGATQVRLVDATREAARAIARGDTPDESLGRARQVAPSGSVLSVAGDDDRVVVTGTVDVDGVGGLFQVLPSVTVSAAATAAREEPP